MHLIQIKLKARQVLSCPLLCCRPTIARGAAALRDFSPAYVGSGSKPEKLRTSICFTGLPPKADHHLRVEYHEVARPTSPTQELGWRGKRLARPVVIPLANKDKREYATAATNRMVNTTAQTSAGSGVGSS